MPASDKSNDAEKLSIDVFWSFRSPWSYLATPRLAEWERRYELEVRFRPVYPIAVRRPEFFEEVNALWFPYFIRDLRRVAEFLEIPLTWPSPDPIVSSMKNGRPDIAAEQPYIHRLTRIGVVAAEQGRGIAFADAVSTLIWGGTKDWHTGDKLAEATRAAGLDLEELDHIAIAEVDRIEEEIAQNESAHEAAGHWGVPTCVFRGEPFFGQDRLDVLLWRLEKSRLKEA